MGRGSSAYKDGPPCLAEDIDLTKNEVELCLTELEGISFMGGFEQHLRDLNDNMIKFGTIPIVEEFVHTHPHNCLQLKAQIKTSRMR